jgi:GNAT superfamily N-acetyltransferase
MNAAANVVVRRAGVNDVAALSELCAAHAAYERATFDSTGHRQRLASALASLQPRVRLIIAEHDGTPVGYAASTREFSTWSGREYLHMDCLFVTDTRRGQGIGQRLFEAVTAAAQHDGIRRIQWQTPDWNVDAIRFYQRCGAQAEPKQRFRIILDSR